MFQVQLVLETSFSDAIFTMQHETSRKHPVGNYEGFRFYIAQTDMYPTAEAMITSRRIEKNPLSMKASKVNTAVRTAGADGLALLTYKNSFP